MTPYFDHLELDSDLEAEVHFDLVGIICHVGLSANSGHYIYYSYDKVNGQWWRFDDSRIKATDYPFKADIYNENQTEESPYILIYRKCTMEDLGEATPPDHIKDLISEGIDELLENIQNYSSLYESRMNELNEKFVFTKEIYKMLSNPNSENYYWLPTEWLKIWLTSEDIPAINNSILVCDHEKLCTNTSIMKRVSGEAWDILSTKYGYDVELTDNDLCYECTSSYFYEHGKNVRMENEKKHIIASSRNYTTKGFFICKSWYNQWVKTPINRYHELDPNFTIGLACEHGGLLPDADKKSIPVESWEYFCNYFRPEEGVAEFPTKLGSCNECNRTQRDVRYIKNQIESERRREKNSLRIYYNIKRKIELRNRATFKIIPYSWFEDWKFYIDNYQVDTVEDPDNSEFICEHGGLNIDIRKDYIENNHKLDYCVIKSNDWSKIESKYTGAGPEISVYVSSMKYAGNQKLVELECNPEFCAECAETRTLSKFLDSLEFENETIEIIQEPLTSYGMRKKRKIVLNHYTTVEQLKLLIFQELDIDPFQQCLWFDDEVYLEDNTLTLRDYNVTPQGGIIVKIGSNDAKFSTSGDATNGIETGFEGTNLLGSNTDCKNEEHLEQHWACALCTFLNDDLAAKSCSMCGTDR
eukprot:TRINITY_DN4361_c0_g1_i1.p1 TRINITY_DN4361_c0_g1~~TRINITY_DN4361_c0_g1_i1.p1  ORF type:complete len:642 (+),score=129.30 TRINITY_DN4361_c0_g1_i1:1003-2928(+)